MTTAAEKRCFSTAEAMQYLGIKRRSFDKHIVPLCTGIPIGTSVVWEKSELDAAWEKYKDSLKKAGQMLQSDKIDAGSERPAEKGESPWDAAKRPESTPRKPVTKSTSFTKVSAFESARLELSKRRKAG